MTENALSRATHSCRFCDTPLEEIFCDLGMSPASNSMVRLENADAPEPFYPLAVYVCSKCLLVQLPEHKSAEDIFSDDYVYFSSYSDSWLKHCESYCQDMQARFGLGAKSQVIEIASNDGYLLQYFKARAIPVLGIEPASSVAREAERKGIPTLVKMFGRDTARSVVGDGTSADLLLGNNVLAHVPDINDFVSGLKILLKPDGVITIEFPHLLKLIEGIQFDTIYHEHYSYLSLHVVQQVFAAHGLRIFDCDTLTTHGGSLRIYACHDSSAHEMSKNVEQVLASEAAAGLLKIDGYRGFDDLVRKVKRDLLSFLIDVKTQGKCVAGYGAAAKGNTLLNYCGIRGDFIDFVADRSTAKQGRLLPGTRIPVVDPSVIETAKPDYLVILPWNLRDEIVTSMSGIRSWGGKFVIPLPGVEIID